MSGSYRFLALQEVIAPGDDRVRIAVNDTACLMPEVARKLGIIAVPIGHDTNENAVTMSVVSSPRLCAVYAHILERSDEDGPDASVVALRPGEGIPAIWFSAITTARTLDRMAVIDVDTAGAGVGVAATTAAKAMRTGASCDEVAGVARDVLQRYRF